MTCFGLSISGFEKFGKPVNATFFLVLVGMNVVVHRGRNVGAPKFRRGDSINTPQCGVVFAITTFFSWGEFSFLLILDDALLS